ncbi:MAG: RidA family protein [Aeromicrobium sp.]|uniref:RidA family protein n=1 Tax=Aeromicrobium sp. TaxID=1871063 RepID=UPI0025BAFC68|nr:RidA family protein [Aeromicrobium sp.]MCK5891595.1 RidA family protein [Aeromicrobium sp.]MDF1704835.1 RidA family protein [Aeromicrobium sp.]
MSAVADRLAALGLSVPPVAKPVAAYVPAVAHGGVVFTSGQLPFVDGALVAMGKVGADVEPGEAHQLARVAALNAIAAVGSVVDLDRVVQVLKVGVFVASAPGFTGQPAVADGASDLLAAAFGSAGRHARSAVGVAELPLGSPVEIELQVAVRA